MSAPYYVILHEELKEFYLICNVCLRTVYLDWHLISYLFFYLTLCFNSLSFRVLCLVYFILHVVQYALSMLFTHSSVYLINYSLSFFPNVSWITLLQIIFCTYENRGNSFDLWLLFLSVKFQSKLIHAFLDLFSWL